MTNVIAFMELFNIFLLHIFCSGILIIFILGAFGCIIFGILDFFGII